jgi:hypothetical protein
MFKKLKKSKNYFIKSQKVEPLQLMKKFIFQLRVKKSYLKHTSYAQNILVQIVQLVLLALEVNSLDKRETIHHMEDPELNQLKNAYVKLIR